MVEDLRATGESFYVALLHDVLIRRRWHSRVEVGDKLDFAQVTGVVYKKILATARSRLGALLQERDLDGDEPMSRVPARLNQFVGCSLEVIGTAAGIGGDGHKADAGGRTGTATATAVDGTEGAAISEPEDLSELSNRKFRSLSFQTKIDGEKEKRVAKKAEKEEDEWSGGGRKPGTCSRSWRLCLEHAVGGWNCWPTV